ncbi:MAG: crossover junction endodeoxyribonuclease RuvC [Patescibacteria group bacterium]
MRVLAIDPGYGRCGVAIVDKDGGKEILIYSACIETSAKMDFPERLARIVSECERLMKQYKPDSIAIETLYITKNQKTAMHVAEVRGALIGATARAGLPIFEYTPGEVKSAAAGNGRADKKAVIKMLHALLKIEKEIKYDDEYDAIAIGITHLARHREQGSSLGI